MTKETPKLGTADSTDKARAHLEAAQSAHDDHVAKLAEARARADALTEDASGVSGAEFTKAMNARDYLTASLPGKTKALAAARQAYMTAVTAEVAAEVDEDASNRWGIGDLPEALENLRTAVQGVRRITESYNAGRSRAIARLLQAGLIYGQCDPFAPAIAQPRQRGESEASLYIRGSEVGYYDTSALIHNEVTRFLSNRDLEA